MRIIEIKEPILFVDFIKSNTKKGRYSVHNWLIDSKLAKSITFHKLKVF